MTKGEQTRRRIVEAAAPIFNRKGYEGSSIQDLMAATGLQKGGIYRHFSGKEELAAEAFDYTWEAAWKTRLRQIDKKATGVEQLKQLIANFIEQRPPVAGGCPVLNTAIDADDGNAVLRSRVSRALRSWMNFLRKIVAEAQERGEISPAVEPEAVATLIVASLEGGLMISRLERSDRALRRIESHLYEYLDREIAVPSARNPQRGRPSRS